MRKGHGMLVVNNWLAVALSTAPIRSYPIYLLYHGYHHPCSPPQAFMLASQVQEPVYCQNQARLGACTAPLLPRAAADPFVARWRLRNRVWHVPTSAWAPRHQLPFLAGLFIRCLLAGVGAWPLRLAYPSKCQVQARAYRPCGFGQCVLPALLGGACHHEQAATGHIEGLRWVV